MQQNAQNYSALISNKTQREQTELQLKNISLSQSAARKSKNINMTPSSEDISLDSPEGHLNSVMSDLNRLSKSFVNSYQNLEGQVEQLNGQLQNVSEQRIEAIEEKQAIAERLQNLLAILPSGVVVLDGKGIVRDCNAVAIDILGRPLLGESWLSVINRAFMPQADDGHQISLKDGRKVHLETRALDSEPGQMIVLTDMTKTRQLQSELSQQQKLSSMGKMIASLAHQIRTPLAAALLYGSHINAQKITEVKKQEFSAHLMERLRFMDRQINDMLNFVKGETKQKIFFNVSTFIDLIKNACNTLTHSMIFEISTEINTGKKIFGDSDALVGAIINLVNNAIDASKNNKPVVIKMVETRQQRLIVEVNDQGSGISQDDQKKLFDPFFSTKNNGNGLGLAIAHTIISEHNGTVKVVSKLSEGSRFIIDLPLCLVNKTDFQTSENAEASIKTFSQESLYDD